jgi:hypothetical protein
VDKQKQEKIQSNLGKAYTEYSGKPHEAIDKLLKEKQGYVPAAMYKESIGDISFVWGKALSDNRGYGLEHIIRKRTKIDGQDGEAFVRKIPEIIEKGKIIDDENKIWKDKNRKEIRYILEYSGEKIIISDNFNGQKHNWVISGYDKDRKGAGWKR